jgi:hypothetical protein
MPVDEAAAAAIGLDVPRSPAELAFAKFKYMEADYYAAASILRPEPLLEFALWWLHEHVPVHRTRPSWVQGDTGPGQFMVHDGRITALIDWELSHIGDPMLDLGVMRMRNQLYPIGDLCAHLDYYAELSGQPLETDALCYYTVLAMTLSPIGMAATIQHPDAGVPSMMPRFGWDVTLRRGLCDALCEAYGVEVDPPTIPEPLGPTRTDLHRFLVDHLDLQCMPIAHDDHEEFVMSGALGAARAVDLHHRIGRQLDADDLDDIGRVLGEVVHDREDGMSALANLVATDSEGHAFDLLWLFSRMERRREHLWGPLMIAQQSLPFERRFPSRRLLSGPAG